MAYYGVDVRTPIFYRQSFASALETQSSKTYARLTHTPVIAEHLPRGAASGARIAQYGTTRLRSLEELEKLLHIILDDAGAKPLANPLGISTREPGAEECERTVLSPSSLARVQAAQPSAAGPLTRAGKAELHNVSSPANESLSNVGDSYLYSQNNNNSTSHTSRAGVTQAHANSALASSTARKMPRSVSFPPESNGVTPRKQRGSAGDPAAGESRSTQVWHWLRGWVWRGVPPSTATSAANPREDVGFNASASTRPYRREHTTINLNTHTTSAAATMPVGSQPLPPSRNAATTASAGVPMWVRAAFTPAAAALAAATVDSSNNKDSNLNANNYSSIVSRRNAARSHRAPSAQDALIGAVGEREEEEENSEEAASMPTLRDDDHDSSGMPLNGGVSGFYSAPLSANLNGETSGKRTSQKRNKNTTDDTAWQASAALHVSQNEDASSQSTQSPHGGRSAADASSSSPSHLDDPSLRRWRRQTSSNGGQDGSLEDTLRNSVRTDVPNANSNNNNNGSTSSPPPPPSEGHTQGNSSGSAKDASNSNNNINVDDGSGHSAALTEQSKRPSSRKGQPPLPATSMLGTPSTTLGSTKTQPFNESSSGDKSNSVTVSAKPDANDTEHPVSSAKAASAGATPAASAYTKDQINACNTSTTSDRHDLATASSSFTATHHGGPWHSNTNGNSGGVSGVMPVELPQPQPRITTQHSVASHNTAGTTALMRWDRHAYAVELVGWLHLIVWVRCQVIHFLRDLSGVQGFVAWSAWYWSWAQEHTRQAAFHQALSSRRFWRGLWARGLSAQLSEVQYETSGHMFTLKNEFRLIVSYIGAAYTSLEQLNSMILQIQHQCEMTTSPMAAAAAAAAARSCVANNCGGGGGGGVSVTTIPDLNSSVNRAYALGRRDLLSPQSSIFWSPAPVTMVADDFSPLAPRPRDYVEGRAEALANPYGVQRSAFDDAAGVSTSAAAAAAEQDSVNETAVVEAAEEVEAAAALHVLDRLRSAVWSMLQEQRDMFRGNVRQLEVLESNDYFGWPGDVGHVEGRTNVNLSTTHATGLPMYAESVLFNASPVNETLLGSSSMRLHEATRLQGEDRDGQEPGFNGGSGGGEGANRPVTARDGAVALLLCVQDSRRLVLRLKTLVQRAHNPPASRHWQRIVVAAAATMPPFIWLYRKTPTELIALARGRYHLAQQIVKSYLLEPIAQLKESLFYVRPGVEDRRGAFERDAVSLANIIRDFHEDMYPNMPQDRLEQMRDVTLDRLRAGVGDPEGFGLIEQQYRHSLRHPIRSAIFGDLPRILLIQLSYQALEMSRVANGVDEVLEGNDLNFKVMALLPVFAAGSLFVMWGFFRYRANYKPIRMRMKLLWRSLFRVISFAGSGQQMLPPFIRGLAQHGETNLNPSSPAAAAQFPRRAVASNGVERTPGRGQSTSNHNTKIGTSRGRSTTRVGAGAATPPSANVWRGKGDARYVEEVDPAHFTGSSEDDDTSSMAASVNTRDDAASARQLNNYEQGMVLLLSHVIRSLAAEYLRSYEYFHELVEDLNDLESVQSSRHQRLATLERMRATHASLF